MRKVHMTRRLCSQKGFTLIELMAVLAILAIILAIAVPSIGKILDKAEESADESAIDLIEHAGELADVDKEPHDTVVAPPGGDEFSVPEKDSYSVPTLVKKGYLKLDKDSKFYAPGEYVTKKNKGGEYVYKGKAGTGSDDGETPDYVAGLTCDDALADGYDKCISNRAELEGIKDGLGLRYIVVNDINLGDSDWTPVEFAGELNGNGYEIQNMTINADYTVDGIEHVGLISKAPAGYGGLTVRNLAMTDVAVASENSLTTGSVLGYADFYDDGLLVFENVDVDGRVKGKIGYDTYSSLGEPWGEEMGVGGVIGAQMGVGAAFTDITFTGSVSSVGSEQSLGTGGLAGTLTSYDGDLLVKDSVLDVAIEVSDGYGAAGMVGYYEIYQEYATVAADLGNGVTENVQVTGTINAPDSSSVGGLLGWHYVEGDAIIESSSFTGDISANDDVGGIAGYFETGGGSTVRNTFAEGAISSTSDRGYSATGGLMGYYITYSGDVLETNIGFYYPAPSVIENVGFVGSVNANSKAGGLIGEYQAANVTYSLRDAHVAGDITGVGQVGGVLAYIASSEGSDGGVIEQISATGSVTAVASDDADEDSNAGGLIGQIGFDGYSGYGGDEAEPLEVIALNDSYSAVTLRSDDYAGGIVGKVVNNEVLLTNTYATGALASGVASGGLVGQFKQAGYSVDESHDFNFAAKSSFVYPTSVSATSGSPFEVIGSDVPELAVIDNTYTWETATASANKTGVTGTISVADAKKQATYENAGWDFETVWKMGASGYPILQ